MDTWEALESLTSETQSEWSGRVAKVYVVAWDCMARSLMDSSLEKGGQEDELETRKIRRMR